MLQGLCALGLGLLGLALLVSTAPLYTWFSSTLPPEDNLSALMSFLLLLALGAWSCCAWPGKSSAADPDSARPRPEKRGKCLQPDLA